MSVVLKLARFGTVLSVLALASCGYGFQGGGTVLPPDIKTVAVEPVENDTTESGLALRLREALRSRFDQYGAVRIVESGDQADALLETRIVSVDSRVRNTSGVNDFAVSLDLVMTVSAELKRRNGEILWKDNKLQVDQPFANVGDVVVTSSSSFAQGDIGSQTLGSLDTLQVSKAQKEQALGDLIEETARQVYFEAVAADF